MKDSTNPDSVQLHLIFRQEMSVDARSLIATLDPLKLFAEYDEAYQLYVVRCLDTGAVATGETLDEALTLMKGILENDIKIALEANTLESLFHASAPSDVRARWYEAKAVSPASVQTIELAIPSTDEGVQPRRGVQSELRIGKTKEESSVA